MFDTMWQVNRERLNEMLAVAESQRLLKAKPMRVGPRERVFAKIGDFLVAFGLKLKERHAPILSESPSKDAGTNQSSAGRTTIDTWAQKREVLI